ncbi:glycoside hydrolase, partial [Lichtheimia hyalospora FSU 10163]
DAFVSTNGPTFTLGDSKFYFEGTNAYYLMTSAQSDVQDLFKQASAAKLPVVRTWLFNSGSDDVWFQKWDKDSNKMIINDDDETGLGRMDYVVQQAAKNNIKVIFAFTNNWQDYGGMDYYTQNMGGQYHDDFYTNKDIIGAYKAYIEHILNRENKLTGKAYKDDPAIFGWELSNEPRCEGGGSLKKSSNCNTDTITKWADDISTYIKSIDKNHLVAVGDEGFFNDASSSDWPYNGGNGIDFDALIALENIDFGTFHLYPDSWEENYDTWATQWIKDHISSQMDAGKPVIMEEYGVSAELRSKVYPAWQKTVEEGDLAADAFW